VTQPLSGDEPGNDWLIVGTVLKPHGVHGAVLVEIVTDFPERVREGVRFGLGGAEGPQAMYEVHQIREHNRGLILSVRDMRSREEAEAWRGKHLFLPPLSRDELPEGYYYEHELVGLRCQTVAGQSKGVITGLDQGPGQSRLVVELEGVEYLVPWVPEIVTLVDLDTGVVVVDPPLGLLE